ncbi:hypothetical protein LX15_004966 [Streptoalloteichus tenebrarius]|uniref:Transposase n=2 Tax=Streptoalloteichus tenebrarius (strain ATCC 17920 / DSM 40477 / JCM 4838 / CBS 697.72 / NBRC 16177 / NCIMB 11028 / NRRL B-12390 / A12253. 1 / ISP 5477) TaxID=1933 RepID=A0ABT1I0W1_STRSD|nr:hypothetical protein [Streptoalloteichus tenebrarius]
MAIDGIKGAAEGIKKNSNRPSNVEPPHEGSRNYDVYDPANKGRRITDIDIIENRILWERKSAAWVQIPEDWVRQQVVKKLNSYIEAQKYMPGCERRRSESDSRRRASKPRRGKKLRTASTRCVEVTLM